MHPDNSQIKANLERPNVRQTSVNSLKSSGQETANSTNNNELIVDGLFYNIGYFFKNIFKKPTQETKPAELAEPVRTDHNPSENVRGENKNHTSSAIKVFFIRMFQKISSFFSNFFKNSHSTSIPSEREAKARLEVAEKQARLEIEQEEARLALAAQEEQEKATIIYEQRNEKILMKLYKKMFPNIMLQFLVEKEDAIRSQSLTEEEISMKILLCSQQEEQARLVISEEQESSDLRSALRFCKEKSRPIDGELLSWAVQPADEYKQDQQPSKSSLKKTAADFIKNCVQMNATG